jgi:trans-2,3-dihydro-3-hydroxyanthranilate isomerase
MHMRYAFYTADVFTDHIFGGNQLAVLPDARGLNAEQMQQITREFNLSETVFVFPPQQPQHTYQLRIFTPGMEVPFAGHPTIGTAYILATIGAITLEGDQTAIVFEEGVGAVGVNIHARDGRPVFAQLSAAKLPEFGPPPPPIAAIAALLSLDVADVLTGADAPQAISCGVPFLFIPLRDRGALRRIRLDRAQWEQHFARFWAPHIYVFTRDAELANSQLRARMFAPAMDIAEDPATGAAATALGGYLGVREPARTGTGRWVVEQGFEMGRPSILEIEVDKQDEAITAVRVGGSAVLVSQGEMEIPTRAA